MNELYEAQEHLQKAQHALQKAMNGGQMGQRNNGGWNGGSMGNNGGNGNYNQRDGMPGWFIKKLWENGNNMGDMNGFDPRFM